MTIVFTDADGTTVSIDYEDSELYITVGGENQVDKRDNTVHIEDVDKFIDALRFVKGE